MWLFSTKLFIITIAFILRRKIMVIHLTKENFKNIVLESEKPVLVEFWATWCSPCQRLAPILDDLAIDINPHGVVAKLDVDDQYEIADEFGIMNIPTIILFKDGKIEDSMLGIHSKDTLKAFMGL
jgi:thioredoxin 1